MLTGQPKAEARLSPRVVLSALVLTSIAISECVARRSQPQPHSGGGSGNNHGLMTNLIPFKSINLGVLVYYILLSSQALCTYLFINWLDILDVLDFSSIWNGSSKVVASTANQIPTLLLMCLLGTLSKAKAHTRRKMEEWWQERQLSEKYQQMRRFLVFNSWRQAAYRVEPATEGGTEVRGRELWRGVRGRPQQAGSYELEVRQECSYELEMKQVGSDELEVKQAKSYEPEVKQDGSYEQEVSQASSHVLEVKQAGSYELEDRQAESYKLDLGQTGNYVLEARQAENYKLEEQSQEANQARDFGAHNLSASQSMCQQSKLSIQIASKKREKLGEDQERKQAICVVKPKHKVILVKEVDDVVM